MNALILFDLSIGMWSSPASLAAENPLLLSITIEPAKPHVGPATIDVRVLNADGKPVSDASVTIFASMPALRMGSPMPMVSMGMLGPTLHVTGIGNGYYRAHVKLNHATLWTFVVHASTKYAYGTATMNVDVK
jgi:hypothetical protein